jgi:hypothetical protein
MSVTIAMVVSPAAVVIAMSTVLVSMPRLIFRHIDFVIPSVLHEIDRSATGIVFVAMLAPLFCVSRRNV